MRAHRARGAEELGWGVFYPQVPDAEEGPRRVAGRRAAAPSRIVDKSQPDLLMQTLRKIPDFTRLLTMGETFAPLEERDVEWIGTFTQKGRRTIPMSMGVMEGDRVVVTEGPLVGREALIKRVNRHKSLAILELQICGRTVTIKVGVGIVGKSGTGKDS